MLDRVLKRLDQEILKRALDGWNRPIPPETAAFEAGRRQGNHQGLQVARALVEELMRGDDEDAKPGNSAAGAADRTVRSVPRY